MEVEVRGREPLWFEDGSPVRAASALARLGDGWLVAQDDATYAAWLRGGAARRLRVFPPVDGHDVFSSAEGTKHLKPDVEAAVDVTDGVLLLGSGSTPRRMRVALVRPSGEASVVDLSPVYADVAAALGLPADLLNLEGACARGGTLRWFQRGVAGAASGSVDVDLTVLLGVVTGRPATVEVQRPLRYDLGTVRGCGLAVTDALALPDGRVLVSAAAEDTPDPYDDGPVVGTALALLDDDRVVAVAPLPELEGQPDKVEGLGLGGLDEAGADLVAVVDADDPGTPSVRLDLRVTW